MGDRRRAAARLEETPVLQRPLRIGFTAALILTSTAMLFSNASAQSWTQPTNSWVQPTNSWSPQSEWFQYAIKFVCGTSSGDPLQLVPGRYATAVNLFNAGTSDLTLRKRLALAFPPQEQATGEVSDQIEDVMAPGTALQVDCEEIQGEFVFQNPPPATDHIEGFLVIESNRALNVQAVYTAAGDSGDVSIDVEKIAETKVIPRPLVARVKICHYPPGNPGNRHTITIDASALNAHKAHGDTLGDCPHD
jgi:hypothetical protein